jgi:hypothetical protein
MRNGRATRAAREAMLPGLETIRGVQEGFTSAVETGRDLNLRLIDMAQMNTLAAFNFAREIAEAKGPSDLVQAWATSATKQFDMVTKQATELSRLGQRFGNLMPDLKGR